VAKGHALKATTVLLHMLWRPTKMWWTRIAAVQCYVSCQYWVTVCNWQPRNGRKLLIKLIYREEAGCVHFSLSVEVCRAVTKCRVSSDYLPTFRASRP